jgi:hypothetical protein
MMSTWWGTGGGGWRRRKEDKGEGRGVKKEDVVGEEEGGRGAGWNRRRVVQAMPWPTKYPNPNETNPRGPLNN